MNDSDKKQQIQAASQAAKNYPDLVRLLKTIGVTGYLYEVASQVVIYRFADDKLHVSAPQDTRNLSIASVFDGDAFRKVLKDSQEGRIDFPAFLQGTAAAGIKAYDADFQSMTVSYYGAKDVIVEAIPQ